MDIQEIKKSDDWKTTKPGNWYSVKATGDLPTERAGHALVPVLNEKGYAESVLCIGGATLDGLLVELFKLNLKDLIWEEVLHPGFYGRYEHVAFSLGVSPQNKVMVWGGAQPDNNVGKLQILDQKSGTWIDCECKGCEPSPRTHHTTALIEGKKLVVWGGGNRGMEPISDDRVHILDTEKMTWYQPVVYGQPPPVRQGHALVAIKNKVFMHGGMDGPMFFDDLWVLDTDTWRWKEEMTGGADIPAGRASHGAVACDNKIFIMGGMCLSGPYDDLYCLHTDTFIWYKLNTGFIPPCLDFGSCLVAFQIQGDLAQEMKQLKINDGDTADSEEKTDVNVILAHGGVDTDGNMFNEWFAYRVT